MNRIKLFLFLIGSFFLNSCHIYSFTGTNLSKEIKTFTVQNFGMTTAGGPQNMSLNFSNDLKEYYQKNTNLKKKDLDGDIVIEGNFITYEISPVTVTANDKAAMNRLTITVEVKYHNKLKEEEDFEKEFSFYQDYSQTQTLTQVEGTLVPKITNQIILNIFNATAATW